MIVLSLSNSVKITSRQILTFGWTELVVRSRFSLVYFPNCFPPIDALWVIVCVCVRHACNNNRSEICLLISRQLHWASRECCCHHNWYSDDKVENAGDTWLLLLSLLGSSHRGIWMQPTNEMRPRWYSRLLLALWDLFQSTVFLSVTSCF